MNNDDRVSVLGRVGVRGVGQIEPDDLGSSRSMLGVVRGETGAMTRALIATGLRTLLIVPGFWLAGSRGPRLWLGASAASSTITVFLLFWYAAQERGRRAAVRNTEIPEPIYAGERVIDSTTATEAT